MNIAIISGGSRGIGYALACKLDKRGLDELWLISRTEPSKACFKTKTRHFPLDITASSFTDTVRSALSEGEYTVKYLVCSAGVGYMGKVEELSEESIEKMITLNCAALSLLTRACIPYIKEGGKIIEIASGAGFLPQPGFSVYAATKSYVISFSRALQRELKPKKINVTCVCPGPVDTDFFKELDPPEYKKKYVISAKKVAKKALLASEKRKVICSPSFSIKLVHLVSKLLPTSFILKFYK